MMRVTVKTAIFISFTFSLLGPGWAENRSPARSYPEPIPPSPWMETHERWVFISDRPLEEMLDQGANVVTGGTNAAGPGFAGGPYGLNGKGEIVHIVTGEPIKNVEEIRARVEKAHARGAKVLGELMRFWNNAVLLHEHPEWQEIARPGDQPKGPEVQGKGLPVTGCWNSPFGDFFIKQCVELARRLGWDGYNLDGFGCWMQCYCPACRDSYRADAGKEIPAGQDLNDPEFRRYLKWRLNRYTHFVARWQRALKAFKPDFVAAPWSTGPGRWWHWSFAPFAECSDAANRLLDAPMVELFWDFPPDQGTNLLPSFTVRYYRGLAGDRPPVMLPYYCTQGQMNMQPPQVECDFRTLTVLANGALAVQGAWQRNRDFPVGHYLKLIREREPWTAGAKSLKWAALLVSESSRLLYGVPGKRSEVPIGNWIGSGVDTQDVSKLPPGERRLPAHMESAVGVFRAAMEDHLPLDFIVEQDVEEKGPLGRYQVLILPNAACLSEAAIRNVREFVNAGGGLVAMQESSLCDEFGARRGNFGLSDLFGASFQGTKDFSARWPEYPAVTEITLAAHEVTEDPVIVNNFRYGSDRLNFIGWTTDVKASEGVKVAATRLADPAARPFLMLSERGKGRVAYFAADVGQSYFLAPYQYQRRLITRAIQWAAGERRAPIRVEAPLCVQAAFYEQDGGRRQIVHLLNEINTTADRAIPENNSSMREEVVPIGGIKVRFSDRSIRRVQLEPEHEELPLQPAEGGVEVSVPVLKLHSMVVAER